MGAIVFNVRLSVDRTCEIIVANIWNGVRKTGEIIAIIYGHVLR